MLQLGNTWRSCAVVCVVTAYTVGLGGCSQTPTGLSGIQPTEYVAYFCNTTGNRMLYSYNPYTQVLDSASLNYELSDGEYFRGVTVSPDGTLLYMPVQSRSKVVVFDIGTLNVVTELPYKTGAPVAISPDGQWLAIFGTDLYILSADDYSVAFHDTSNIYRGVFSANGQRLYAPYIQTEPPFAGSVYCLDLSGAEPQVELLPSPGRLYLIVPTSDESKYLLYSASGSFAVYDVAADSVVLTHYMRGERGRIALTPDDKYAFYGNPGTVLPPDPGSSSLCVIDVENSLVADVVDTRMEVNGQTVEYFEVGSLKVTPDGKYLIMLDAPSAHQLLLYDIESRQFVDYVNNTGNVQFSDLDVRAVSE